MLCKLLITNLNYKISLNEDIKDVYYYCVSKYVPTHTVHSLYSTLLKYLMTKVKELQFQILVSLPELSVKFMNYSVNYYQINIKNLKNVELIRIFRFYQNLEITVVYALLPN